jgi:Uri superfamily endonuclease
MHTLTKGTYALVLSLKTDQNIQISKLGCFRFPKGHYVYVGSAFGPGGLNARLTHHLNFAVKPHWHIDYFKKNAITTNIRVDESNIRLEHQWASILKKKKRHHHSRSKIRCIGL